ncbi:hypothetical protein Tco_0154478 [Tanacetum coccineum]
MNQNYDPNFCYNPIYSGFDQIQPQQFSTVQLLEIERINKEESFKKKDMSIEEIMSEKRLIDDEIKDITNDLSYKRFRGGASSSNFLLNWNFPMADDDEYTIIYRKPKAMTPDLPAEEPDNSISMGDEHLNTIPETEKSSVENLFPILSESKGISDDICDVTSCDNDHFDVEFGLINSLLNRDISITSPKIDFLPEEFAGELDLIDPILPGIDDDDFDKEE